MTEGRARDGERTLPADRGVVTARPELGGGSATPSFRDLGAATGGPEGWHPHRHGGERRDRPSPTTIGGRRFSWGEQTYVMGIVNVTPDSFSGDGLLADRIPTEPVSSPAEAATVALELAGRMIAEGADLIDVGGESTRPGHEIVDANEEARRIVPVVAAIRAAHPAVPISVDTTKPSVAAAAIDAGASLVNDIWGVAPDSSLARLAAERGIPIVLMHNRSAAAYDDVVEEVLDELAAAVRRAIDAGIPEDAIVVDPGFGFGKAPRHNLELLAGLERLTALGRPILLGASRKSTLGKVLDLPPEDRLEATLATTALAVAAGVDIVRVHDVGENVRVARMADAVVRGWDPAREHGEMPAPDTRS
jgi:dihydropteroate synthase